MGLKLIPENYSQGADEQLKLFDLAALDREHQHRMLLRIQADRSLRFSVPEQRP